MSRAPVSFLHLLADPRILICDSQAAIVRGAALRGLSDIAPNRKRCRRHYGVAYSATFREGIDPESDVKYDSWNGRKQCNSRMDWQVKKVCRRFEMGECPLTNAPGTNNR